jgi:NAD(P)H dehydrogenase (quinone)
MEVQQMKKVLIAYDSRTGKTETMAEFIAEGVRFAGNEAILKKLSEIKSEKELQGYDGYVFGSPTYHGDMTMGMKKVLFLAAKAKLAGKAGGAFGSHTHTGEAPALIFGTMENVFKMDMVSLGSFKLTEGEIEQGNAAGSCQQYGKAVSENA